jgi:YVTN family beta-propeller protein
VVESIALDFMPNFVAYHGDMKKIWIADPMARKMIHVRAFATSEGSHNITFKNMTAHVTNQETVSVSVIDVTQYKVTKTISAGKNQMELSLDK